MTPSPMEPRTPPPTAPAIDLKDVEENKDLAAFSYVWIFSVLMYFHKRNSPFVRFHARQGMALFALSIAFMFIPFLWRFLEFAVLFLSGWGFLHAAQGKWDEVPFIGPLVRGKLSVRPSLKKAVEGVVSGMDRAKVIWKESDDHHPHSHEDIVKNASAKPGDSGLGTGQPGQYDSVHNR